MFLGVTLEFLRLVNFFSMAFVLRLDPPWLQLRNHLECEPGQKKKKKEDVEQPFICECFFLIQLELSLRRRSARRCCLLLETNARVASVNGKLVHGKPRSVTKCVA